MVPELAVDQDAVAISVCILTSRRHSELASCLESLVAQVGAPPFEVLVCANDDPETEAVVAQVDPMANVIHSPKARLGSARNLLLARARGELLLFLDDDVTLDSMLMARLHHFAQAHPQVTVFGGPNLTPPHSSLFQAVQGGVLGSLLGAGPVRRRYGSHAPGLADERFFTLCNLAIRRDAMVAFPPEVTGGEENALLLELARREGSMFYDPSLHVYHTRRARLQPFARQMFKYGSGRGQVIVRDRSGLRAAFLAPTAFLAYVALLPVLLVMSPLLAAPLALYGLGVVTTALLLAWRMREVAAAPLAALLVVVIHVSYGAGVVAGLLPVRTSSRARTRLDPLEPG